MNTPIQWKSFARGNRGSRSFPVDLSVRLPVLMGAATGLEQAMRELRILLVGAGSVGWTVGLHLARLPIHTLKIVDHKSLEPKSMATHLIPPEYVGSSKAESLAKACSGIHSKTRFLAWNGPVQQLGLADWAEADLVLLASDNLNAEVVVGERTHQLGKPLIQGSVHGESLTVQVRFFGNQSEESPCPACLFSSEEWTALHRQSRFSCGLNPTHAIAGFGAEPPTNSMSFLCSLAADLAVTQFVRWTMNIGAPVADTLLEHSGYTHRVISTPVQRSKRCPFDHSQFRIVPAPSKLETWSPCDLIRLVEFYDGHQPLTFSVDDMQWADQGQCINGHVIPLNCFVPDSADQHGDCPNCGEALVASAFYKHQEISVPRAGERLNRPLNQLGVHTPRAVLLRRSGHTTLITQQTPNPNRF